jgi:ABC-type hemin transport system substrate-binding protein
MTISSTTYGGSVLSHLSIDLVPVSDGSPYPHVELDEVAAAEPDLIVVPSEPYEFGARHVGELGAALPDAHIIEVDGQDLFWWGIRTPGAVRRLEAALALPPTP